MYCTVRVLRASTVVDATHGDPALSPLSPPGGRCRVGRLCGFRASVHRGVRSGPLQPYLRSYAPPLRGGSSGERTHAAELRGDVAAWGDVSKVSKCMLV